MQYIWYAHLLILSLPQYMSWNREICSIWSLSLPQYYWHKYIQSNIQVTDSWNCFDLTGILFPLNVLSNLNCLWPKHWFMILLMKKVKALDIPKHQQNTISLGKYFLYFYYLVILFHLDFGYIGLWVSSAKCTIFLQVISSIKSEKTNIKWKEN